MCGDFSPRKSRASDAVLTTRFAVGDAFAASHGVATFLAPPAPKRENRTATTAVEKAAKAAKAEEARVQALRDAAKSPEELAAEAKAKNKVPLALQLQVNHSPTIEYNSPNYDERRRKPTAC